MDENNQNVVIKQPEIGESRSENLPKGLAELNRSKSVHVHQHLDVVEVILGWQRNNRYTINNSDDEQCLYAYEVSDCGARQCVGASRAFTIKIVDIEQQPVVAVHRPLRCSSRWLWWCCNLQTMEIHSPPGNPVASMIEIWSCCLPLYKVKDNHGSVIFKLQGGCCHSRCCGNVIFHVYSNADGCEVATITKHWGGCRELIGAANDFSIEYQKQLEMIQKVIILGATFLIDFNYFERHGCCC